MSKLEKPVFGTEEWAKYSANCISGCSHNCKYCYAKEMAVRYGRKTPDNWQDEIVNHDKLEKNFRKRDGRFMFPTSHDITPDVLNYCMSFLEKILKAGNEVLIVSKPHLDCIRAICARFNEYQEQILFRFTIGSTDNATLRFWEPYAPSFDERMESLVYAYHLGFATSVSCEPLLDNKADELISRFSPYVTDTIWIGKVNNMMYRLRMNGYIDTETITRATKLMNDLSDNYFIDLYERYKDNFQIKWKESVKKVIGIVVPVERGLDI
jgi:DNA repair photolyase